MFSEVFAWQPSEPTLDGIMKLEEAPCQLPINVAFESASGAPKSFGLLRAGSREGEPGREKMIDSMVPRRSVTLDESHAPSRSQVAPL